ncbi:MAG: tetratricopeptide repeat-containing sensor histidine kinase [Cyclobacteriaceae bacterium]|nr:tetratricopeptide repeat-containing sensor histidine kinase [Cyclobacteriaceae bacterium]
MRVILLLLLTAVLFTTEAQQARIQELLDRGNTVSEFNPDSALLLFEQALALANGKDTLMIPRIYNRFAQAYSMKGNYTEAAKFLVQALTYAEALKDTVALIDGNNNMGIDWMYQEEYEKALTYFKIAEQLASQSHDSLRWGHALNNLGLTVGYMGLAKEELQYYNRAAAIFKNINELEGYANTILNTATLLTAEGKYKDAERLYQEALSIYKGMDYANAQGMVYQSMAENAREGGHYNHALNYIRQSLKIAHTNGYTTEEASGLRLASTIFKEMKLFDSAYYYLDKHRELRNTIFNSEKNKITSELEARYQTEIKERKIKSLEQENTIKDLRATTARQWQISLVILVILITGLLGVLYNRYQLKQRTAKVLDEKNTELQKLNSFKDKMFAVISHDLRNPVDAFSTLMESLTQNLQHASPEELKEFLESMLHSARDLKSLLDNLLEWSMVQIGKLPFHPKAFAVTQAVQESIAHVHAMAHVNKINIKTDGPDVSVQADKNMVVIIIRNLLTNAIKFSPPGKTISISTTRNANTVLLAVRDEGIGMTTEEVAKLFKTADDARTVGGSLAKGAGIGLLLCKELTEKNNGKIYAESVPGSGSTFYLELPQ